MDKLSAVITFIETRRKILISLFFFLAIFFAILDGIILVQRPQTFYSKASSKTPAKVIPPGEPDLTQKLQEFISPTGFYKLPYDPRQWVYATQPDEIFGSKAVFNLREEYGHARADFIEGESQKDLDRLKDEVIKTSTSKLISAESALFKEKPSYLLTFQEEILGKTTYYYQQIVKDNNKFLIIEKRFPSLGYHLPYLDNLLEGISLGSQASPRVKGISAVGTNLTTVELVDLVRPAVANIAHVFCLDIVNLNPSLSQLTKPQYDFCSLNKGSGFMVSEDGVIATNGHVAKIYPEEALAINLLQESNKVFAMDLIRKIYSSSGQTAMPKQIEEFYSRINSNPQYLDMFLGEIFKLLENKAISTTISNEKFYVNVGNEPVRIDYQKINSQDVNRAIIPSSTTYAADLLDYDYPNKYSYDAIINRKYQSGSDLALLQIKNSSPIFPSLELGDTQNLKEGADVIVAGYPVLVEGGEGPGAAVSFKTSAKPTITKGIVSAVKQDPSGKLVYQTDASIDQGNSGGPAFNLQGQVIGVATFFFESRSGNFNFLRDVSDLKKLMSKNNIDNKPGNLTIAWQKGLGEFRNQYYKQAIEYFTKVQDLNPAHPTVKDFIKASETAIQRGESLEGLAGFVKSGKGSNTMLVVFGGLSTISFMIAGFLTVLPFFSKYDKVV